MKPDKWYEHQVTVVVTTQFPKDGDVIARDVKLTLGWWCSHAKAISLNVPVERPE